MSVEEAYGQLLYRLKAAGRLNMTEEIVRLAQAGEALDVVDRALLRVVYTPDVVWDGVQNGRLTWVGA